MSAQLGKKFIGTMLGVVLALGAFTWFASATHRADDAPGSQAYDARVETGAVETSSRQQANPYPSQVNEAGGPQADGQSGALSSYDEGYRNGYQDSQRDCESTRSSSTAADRYSSGRTYYSTRRASYVRHGVAGERYYAPRRRGHSTRNLILTVAAPAALAAGIGGIAGGGKGAGIGALLGGGGGALYYLVKHRHRAE